MKNCCQVSSSVLTSSRVKSCRGSATTTVHCRTVPYCTAAQRNNLLQHNQSTRSSFFIERITMTNGTLAYDTRLLVDVTTNGDNDKKITRRRGGKRRSENNNNKNKQVSLRRGMQKNEYDHHHHKKKSDTAGTTTTAATTKERQLSSDNKKSSRRRNHSNNKQHSKSRSSSRLRSKKAGVATPSADHHRTIVYRHQTSCLRVKTQFQSMAVKGLMPKGELKLVDFSYLEVREYPFILGDNPSCLDGPPLTIDWGHDPNTEFMLDIDTFERMRGQRRNVHELVVPKRVRQAWLLKCGWTNKQIAEAVRQARRDKHFRMVSSHKKSFDPVSERIENLQSNVKRLFSFRKTEYEKKLEQATLDQPQPVILPSALAASPSKRNYALTA